MSFSDFDQSIAPINSFAQGASGGEYIVRAGDTFSSIAAQLWGDSARRCRGLQCLNSIRRIEFSLRDRH